MKCSDIPEDEIIAACIECHKGGPTPDISLEHKYPVKVILAKMQKMVDKGILDYGVSLRTAWVVEMLAGDPPVQRVLDRIRAVRGLAKAIATDPLYKECEAKLKEMREDPYVKVIMGQHFLDAFHF